MEKTEWKSSEWQLFEATFSEKKGRRKPVSSWWT